MSALTGLPDFGQPVRYGLVSGYAAHEQPGIVCSVPFSITTDALQGSTRPLLVDLYLQERDGEVTKFALVTTAFRIDVPLDTAHRDERASVVARPAPLGDGIGRLVGPTALGLPAEGLPPQPFDAEAGWVLPAFLRLDDTAGTLLVGALDAGLVALGIDAWMSVRGVAARTPGVLTVQAAVLLSGLAAAAVDGGRLDQDRLVALVEAGLPGVEVSGGPDDARQLALAVADRIASRFGTITTEGWRFPTVWERDTLLVWELSLVSPARRVVNLSCDFVVQADPNHDAVHEHVAPPLTDGHMRVVVHPAISAVPAGLVAATVTLTAPPAPPHRPFESSVSGPVVAPAPTELTLELAPAEALVYDLEATAVLETDKGPHPVSGGVRRGLTDPTPILTAADLGIRLVPVHAAADLLRLADVTVMATAIVSGAEFRSEARLVAAAEAGAAHTWLAVPRAATDVALVAIATASGGRSEQALPDAAVWLDAYSFDDPPWSLPGTATPPIVVEAGGLRLVGTRNDPDWRFISLTAGLAVDASGAAQLSLLEAGPMRLLSVTAALGVSDSQQSQARTACLAAGAPPDVRLAPAPVEAEEASLLVLRDGEQTVLASATPSGTASQDAAFSVALSAGDLDTVKRALGGGPGLLAVRYVLTVAATGPVAEALTGGSRQPVTVLSDASTWRT